jgi:hypothetical protein
MADDRPTCVIAMPLTTPIEAIPVYGGDGDHFRHVLEHLFAPACEKAGYRPVRPSTRGAQLIHAEIVKHLEQSDLVLYDHSGHNPNVFFELGIRTALDRPVALVRDEKSEQLAFDTSILNRTLTIRRSAPGRCRFRSTGWLRTYETAPSGPRDRTRCGSISD